MKLPDWLKLIKGNLETEEEEEVNMLFSEPIGGWDGVDAKTFASALAMIPKQKTICLDINCLGGHVSEGMAMYNMLLARKVNTRVIGYAASMGSVIALAGKVRSMMPGTMMMIHNPLAYVEGDYKDMEARAAQLKIVRDGLVDVYNERTKLPKSKIKEMMDATTFMSPKEALDLGFIDQISEGTPALNNFDPAKLASTIKTLTFAARGEAKQQNKQNHIEMKKTIAVLAVLGLNLPADVTDEAAAPQIDAALKSLIAERDGLKADVQKSKEATKNRVTARVQKAIDAKLIKAERKESLIAMGISDESNLDFLDDIPAPAPAQGSDKAAPRRGAPPVPASATNNNEGEETVETLRAELKENRMNVNSLEAGIKNVELARKLREKRGHGSLFAEARTEKKD